MQLLHRAYRKFCEEGPYALSEAVFRRIQNKSILLPVKHISSREFVDVAKLSPQELHAAIEITEEEIIDIDEPKGHGPLPSRYAKFVGRHRIPATSVRTLPDVTVTGTHPVLVSNTGNFLYNHEFKRPFVSRAIRNECREKSQLRMMSKYLGRRPFETENNVDVGCTLLGAGDTNFHHWICHFLTLFQGIEAYVEETGQKPTVIIPADASSYHYETLSLLGYNDDIVTWDGTGTLVEEYVFPEHRYTPAFETWMLFSPSALNWLSHRLCVAVPEPNRNFSKNVYISRKDADKRQIRNEDALVDAIGEFGFERYVLSEMSVTEQIQLFSEAENIISPHGAGLTNFIYADSPKILELIGPDDSDIKVGPHYFGLANSLEFDYRYYVCDDHGQNMEADVDGIQKYMRDWMETGV